MKPAREPASHELCPCSATSRGVRHRPDSEDSITDTIRFIASTVADVVVVD